MIDSMTSIDNRSNKPNNTPDEYFCLLTLLGSWYEMIHVKGKRFFECMQNAEIQHHSITERVDRGGRGYGDKGGGGRG